MFFDLPTAPGACRYRNCLLQQAISVMRVFLLAVISLNASAQTDPVYRYNVDSFLNSIASDSLVRAALNDADALYQAAGIAAEDISLTAFRVGYLEKTFWEAGRIKVRHYKRKQPASYQRNLLTIVDFTRTGRQKRLVTVDLEKRLLLCRSLVSHGSGKGKGANRLRERYGIKEFNTKEQVPVIFGNKNNSYRSSLGLMLTAGGAYPGKQCHLCRFFIDTPHKCGVLLDGLERKINHKVRRREIVMHTTGSRDYSDSLSLALIRARTGGDRISTFANNGCYCIRNGTDSVAAYMSACFTAQHNGFVGRSQGCLALSEEDHMEVMETVQEPSLIFVYSDAVAPSGTHYFAESPLIRQLLAYCRRKNIR